MKPKDLEWAPAKKVLLGDIDKYIENLKGVKTCIDASQFPEVNRQEMDQFLTLDFFNPDIIRTKNSAAGGLCSIDTFSFRFFSFLFSSLCLVPPLSSPPGSKPLT